jgi:hypothetical protein
MATALAEIRAETHTHQAKPSPLPNLALPACIYQIILYSLPNFNFAGLQIRLETSNF